MEILGFRVCPFDPCVFILMRNQKVAGITGIRVDDGIGGGDVYFHAKLAELEKVFPFGSKSSGEMTFTGIRLKQEADMSIRMDQREYVESIPSIHISRERRRDPKSETTEDEKTLLRAINGSFQYAAVHTRPDLAAKDGELQSAVNSSSVETLMQANRTLHDATVQSGSY